MTQKNKKIGLFISSDLIGLIMANLVIPRIMAIGLRPVIFDAGLNKNKKTKLPAPKEINFYVTEIVEKTITPYLNKKSSFEANKFLSYKQLAKKYNLEYIQFININSNEIIEKIALEKYTGLISIRQYQVFEKELILTAKNNGFIWNLHGGLLPDYKGMLAPYRAIMNGEKNYGWTLHEIDEGIDTGCIIGTSQKPLDVKKPVLDTYLDMIEPSVAMIINALQKQLNGTIEEIKQPNTGGKYYSYPTPSEMEAYKKAGIRYINSPKTYVDQIVSLFSNPNTPHGQNLRIELINAITEHFRTERTIITPEEKTAKSA
jgi:methionyl-tRNA formyltransferase